MRDLIPFTFVAEMPRCRYEVFKVGTDEPATVVAVGDALNHKWTCDSSAPGWWWLCSHTNNTVQDCGV
jgi:hypothetical protein